MTAPATPTSPNGSRSRPPAATRARPITVVAVNAAANTHHSARGESSPATITLLPPEMTRGEACRSVPERQSSTSFTEWASSPWISTPRATAPR